MGQIKHKMGNVGGGLDVSHKSKMSGKAKSLMSFPGGMPGPGNYGSMENKVVGKGMGKYLAGESVGMAKYKHKGAAQMDPMHNGKAGVQQEDFEQFSAPDSTGPAKRSRAERQADRDAAKTKRRAGRADKRVKRNKAKVEKLQSKIDLGKENFNVDKDGNKTTGRKANRIERAKKKITDNEKISAKNPKEKPTSGGPMKTDPKKETLGARAARIKAEKKAAKVEKRTTKSSAGDIKAKARKLSALNKSRAKAKQRILTAKKNNVYGKGPAKK
jgi:hypothetical protein